MRLSDRYLTGRQLPDKAVSVLDTACARLAIGQTAMPGAVEDCRRRLDGARSRDRRSSSASRSRRAAHDERLATRRRRRAPGRRRGSTALEAALGAGADAQSSRSARLRGKLEDDATARAAADAAAGRRQARPAHGADAPPPRREHRDRLRAELDASTGELAALQGEDPLMQVVVDAQTVARGHLGLDRHPGRQDDGRRDHDGARR